MTNRYLLRFILLLIDVAALEALFFAVYFLRFRSGIFSNPIGFSVTEIVIPSVVVLLYWLLLLAGFGLYRFDPLRPRSLLLNDSLKASGVGVLFLFIITFDPLQPLPSTRIILAGYGIGIVIVVAGARVLLSTVLRHLRYQGIGIWRVVLVGAGPRANLARQFTESHPELGFRVIGSVCEEHHAAHDRLGTYADIRAVLRDHKATVVVFATEPEEQRALSRLVKLVRDRRIRSFIPADLYPTLVGEVRPEKLRGYPLVEVRPELLSAVERAFKRLFDLVSALFLLILSSPVWIVIAIAIPLESRGSLLYVQQRVGQGGRLFSLLKFRSMRQDAEAFTGAVFAEKNDTRVTRIGRLIRPTRLDELPQFINVLLGQMSMVGPRPERQEFVTRFIRDIPLYERRLNVKPGITGWSQVHLRYDSGADQVPIKLKYDFYYIENMSLPLDLKIMLMTFFVMLRGEGQ